MMNLSWSNAVINFAILVMGLQAIVSAQTDNYPPTVFTQQPQGGLPEVIGNRKVLTCSANGIPSPVYRWIKDGVLVSQNSSDMSLQIKNISLSDAGVYQCIASNQLGSLLSSRATVSVAYMVPYNASPDVVVTAREGHAAVISLPPIGCIPPPAIQWREPGCSPGSPPDCSGYAITGETQRYHVTLNNQIVILETRVAYENNKTFKATIINSFIQQTTESPTYLLSVQDTGNPNGDILPEFVLPPNSMTAIQGDDLVKLECIANARPLNLLSLNWYRKINGSRQLIQQDTKYLLSLYRRTLTIREPVTADSGLYQCEASFIKPGQINSSPPIVAEANLTVYVRPSFLGIPQSELNVDMGMSEVLQCLALGVPAPTVKWYRNSALIDDTMRSRYQLASNGSLRLLNVTASDSGVFQCFVTNSAGELSTSTWLWVGTSGPEIFTLPQNISVITGDSARFMCEAKGAPKPVINWSRVTTSGVLTQLVVSTGHIQLLGGELLIPVTDVGDEGLYVCNATNSFGNDVAEAFLTVTVRTRIDRPPQSLSVILSLNALFQCGVTKDPLVTVVWHWFLESTEITSSDSRRTIQSDGSLEVRNVRNTDIGNYTCVVISVGGNDTASASLKVIELPHAPEITSVQLTPGSNRSVDIAWNPGFDGLSPVKSFILRYRVVTPSVTSVWTIATSSIAPDQLSYTLTDLKPAKSYQFTVSAVNDVGESPQSDPSLVISLPQQPPSGPPRSFTGSPRSNSSFLLQWQAPDPDLMNGDLLGYIIRYKPSGYPDSTISTVNLTTYQDNVVYDLTGLIVFQEYEVAVAAFNSKGVGVYCGSLFIRTFEGIPSMPPTSLVVVAVNSTTFNISWLPPNPQYINGINQGYKIFAQQVNTTVKLTYVVLSKTNNMLGQQTTYLTNLRKFTLYSVSVSCFTSQGDGPLSASATLRTLEDIPDQVSNLSFTNIMDTSLSVVWSPPLTANGILMGYTLTYMQKDLINTKVTTELNATVLNFTITGLTPTTTYTISVWASTRVGAGQSRSADIRSGVTPVLPTAPTSLLVTNIRDRTVLLQFSPGFSGYTSISWWIIEGQTSVNNLQGGWTTIYTTSDPDATALTVLGLQPFTRYRLRVIAENIAGRSNASEATPWFDTLQALPSAPPSDVTVRAINETSIRIRWMVLLNSWNGNSRGYVVQWKLHSIANFSNSVTIADENANSYQLNNLRKYTKYDVQVAAFNSVGVGSFSPTATAQTMESTPTSGPADVAAVTLSSTVIQVSWGNVSEDDRNGLLLGYRVVYYLSSDPSRKLLISVNGSSSTSANVTGLRKFSLYSFCVLAYTGIGDGVPSQPPVQATTFEDFPGPPSSVYFPDVTETTARIVWSPPREPNGNLTGYKVAYGVRSDPQAFPIENNQLGINDRSYLVSSLVRQSYYVFNVTARTTLGWGEPAQVVVFTIAERKAPEAPNKPFVSQVGDRWAVINWTPRGDGYGPIRNFSIEYQMNNGSYTQIDAYVDGNRRDFRADGLKPNSLYRFRVIAFNDIGPSNYSEPSDEVQTEAAAPEAAPTITGIVTETATSMRVSWQPPPEATWNGALLGYDVAYRDGNSNELWQVQTVNNPLQYSAVIGNVQLFVVYEVKVSAFNSKGRSDYSPVSTIYLEIAPSGPVLNLRALNVTSTSALVAWEPPPMSQRNGNILGYKIFYWVTQSPVNSSSVLIAQGSDTSADISVLIPYTSYTVTVLAFNMAGDGPNVTLPLNVTTLEDVPGPPGSLRFVVPSPNSLNTSWDPPLLPNGIIEMYEVSYHQFFQMDGVTKSVQVLLSPDKTNYYTQPLIEDMTYNFSIRAQTSTGWGQPSTSRVTIGPQPGSPEAPSKPTYTVDDKSVTLTWAYGKPGIYPETGCLVQALERSSTVWETKATFTTPEVTAVISFLTIKPKTDYCFRVIAINARGIGPPSEATDFVRSVDVLAEANKPFYQQWWFLVIVALVGVIIIILVVSCLCFTGRRYRSQRQKAEKPTNSLPRTTLQLSQIQTPEANTDNDFSVFEVRRSTRASQRTMSAAPSTSNSRTNLSSSRSARHLPHPPRPSPGRVNYNFDDERKSSPDSSSLSEKASDVSTGSDSDADDPDKGSAAPPTFPSPYVSGTVKNSLGRRNTYNPYSFTDSEQDGSQYAMSLNGGHVMINNVAGSRAPLPGFSSFV